MPRLTMKSLNDVVSCLADYDPDALPVPQAQRVIADFIAPVTAAERVAIRDALGRVLAADVISPIDVPAHDNSAMDGYAFHGDAYLGADLRLAVTGTAYAGRPYTGAVERGDCVHVMTGAVMPDGCDTVVPQEWCRVDGNEVSIPAGTRLRRGDNRRLRGEDLAIGKAALQAGKLVRPADLGLLASLGVAEVAVRRRVRVAFFSTGDELRSIGEPLGPGEIYDSNRYTIYGMLQRLGVDVLDLGVVRDDPAALEAALRDAADAADAIITSGGVSVGAADYTKQIMARLGDIAFWTIAMRPGRPMAFGRVWADDAHTDGRSAYLFGLPGNPVAVMVTFYHFVRDALLRLQGARAMPLPMLTARAAAPMRKKPGRTEYQRGIVEPDHDGGYVARLTGQQGSGVLRSMSDANCFVVLDHDQGDVAPGEPVRVLLFEGLT